MSEKYLSLFIDIISKFRWRNGSNQISTKQKDFSDIQYELKLKKMKDLQFIEDFEQKNEINHINIDNSYIKQQISLRNNLLSEVEFRKEEKKSD